MNKLLIPNYDFGNIHKFPINPIALEKIKKIGIFFLFLTIFATSAFAQNNYKFRAENRKPMSIDVISENRKNLRSRKSRIKINNLQDAQKFANDIRSRFDRQVEKLYSQLQITNEQQQVWNQYVVANRENLPSADVLFQRAKNQIDQNTPNKAKQNLQFIRNQMEKMQKSVDAYDLLYNQCSNTQQQILREVGFHNPVARINKLPKSERFSDR